jgi:hypothetical protein
MFFLGTAERGEVLTTNGGRLSGLASLEERLIEKVLFRDVPPPKKRSQPRFV